MVSFASWVYGYACFANVTLDYLLDVGMLMGIGGLLLLRDLMGTTTGPFCYVYL